jgi:hypothetical protein
MSRGPFADTIDVAAQVTFAAEVRQTTEVTAVGRNKAGGGSGRTRDAAESSETEGSSAPRSVSVPLITPRYERKTRLNRTMSVTESASEDTGRSPAAILSTRSREALSVKQGPVSHEETITYHTYALYRHGSKQVHSQSVGYSSDGDLVLHRRDIAEAGDGHKFVRCDVMVEGAVCLNPRAKPKDPVVEEGTDPTDPRLTRRLRRLQKYPGVRCPKNRKIRNRLINDHFAGPTTRKLYESAHEDSDPDGLREPADPTFAPIPKGLAWLVDTDENQQQRAMERYGIDKPKPLPHTTRSIDSAAFRFAQLQSRMKSELQHAMSTDYMPGFMDDLETRIEQLVAADADGKAASTPTSIEVACRDGYGRLITHGIAAYYKLSSTSESREGGERITVVTLPKKRVPLPEQRLTSHLRGDRVSPTSTFGSRDVPAALVREVRSQRATGGARRLVGVRRGEGRRGSVPCDAAQAIPQAHVARPMDLGRRSRCGRGGVNAPPCFPRAASRAAR